MLDGFMGCIAASSPDDTSRPPKDDYPPSEATQRRDAALRAVLSMPRTPHTESSLKAKSKTKPRAKKSHA
jgi:hypothetical protein